ncbi:glycerate kinase family protein [Mitsuokella jalaludinii]|uniref:glycerate kinase family protein n=1 Tax=Mitsuokella jalaludinii TaxID=187979 RepID=UPI003F9CB784
MMKTVIAIDSFKGCISSMEAGKVLQQAIRSVYPEDTTVVFPLADGGEGTVDAMTQGLHGKIVEVTVTGPLGTPVKSRYGFLPATKTAIIEMADASGLTLVPPEKRNPLYTTTYGLGELILAAMEQGCRHFIIGIGGSATNDCGLGMLTALGFRFLKADGTPAGVLGGSLSEVQAIETGAADARLQDCTFEIACDVTNPLCGPEGCSRIFGPQKGATEAIIERMDQDILRFARLAEAITGTTGRELPGAGAAGGLGFAFHVFLHGTLTPGVDLILSAIGIDRALQDADVLITGEGRMDQQTAMGKAPAGVAQLAKACQPDCLTVALCGSATREAARVNAHGIDAYFPILHAPMPLAEAMDRDTTEANLSQTVEQVMRLVHQAVKR